MPTKLITDLIEEGHTFPRHIRLLTSRDFQRVFRDNKVRVSDNMWSLLARDNDLGHARLGMAISKRVVKNAVQRNRIKRIVRESFRHHQQQLAGLDIVVMCRDGATQANNRELFSSLNRHWKRVIERA
ncbi:ribonuclease P protein component [Kaarinaea lacus]